jgi:hypothetical protein
VGQSIQEGFRLTEKMILTIRGSTFYGEGTDVDGDFVLQGTFDAATGIVSIVRRYTRAPQNPAQVGYPFDYLGKWNGEFVSGRWMTRTDFEIGGPFEMWPEREEEMVERKLDVFTQEATLTL